MIVLTQEMLYAAFGLVTLSLIALIILEAKASENSPEFDREQWEQETEEFNNRIEREQWIKDNCPCE